MNQLAVFYRDNIQPFVIAGTEGKLHIALVAHLKLCVLAALFLIVVWYKVILPQLGGRGQAKGFSQQCTGKDGCRVALLQSWVNCHGGGNGGNEPLRTLGVFQGIVDQLLIAWCRYHNGELWLLSLGRNFIHNGFPPASKIP